MLTFTDLSKFEGFLKDNTISEQKTYLKYHPSEKAKIAQKALAYINSTSSSEAKDPLRLKAWLLLPSKSAKKVNIETINPAILKEDFVQSLVENVKEHWRLEQLKRLGINISDEIEDKSKEDIRLPPLHKACRKGDIKTISGLLESNPSLLHERDKENRTPLHLAAESDSLKAVKLLVSKGAKQNVRDANELTPFDHAKSKIPFNDKILEFLFNKNLLNHDEGSILHKELRSENPQKEVVEFLINKGANLFAKDKEGDTPLHLAIKLELGEEIIRTLLKNQSAGALLLLRNADGNTPLHEALTVNRPNIKIIKHLLDQANLDIANDEGNTPLHLALQNSLIGEDLIGLLISPKHNVNVENTIGATPLFLALTTTPPKNEIIELLIKQGADVNSKDEKGNTLLHLAISRGLPLETVQLLLDHKLDANAINNEGNTPLHMSFRNPSFDVIKLLLDHKADVKIANLNGNTPLHMACTKGISTEIIKLLLDRGAEVNAKTLKENTPLHLAMSALMDKEIIQLLIDRGADVNAKNNFLQTPFHSAFFGKVKSESKKRISENLQLLIDRKVDLSARDHRGQSGTWLMKIWGIQIDVPSVNSQDDREFELRKLLANSWSIPGKTQQRGIEFELAGGKSEFGEMKIVDILKLLKSHRGIESNSLLETLEKGYRRNRESPEKVLQDIIKGKTVLFNTGSANHNLDVSFIDDYLLITNRGIGRMRNSIVACKIDRQKITLEDVKRLQLAEVPDKEFKQYFYKELPTSLGFDSKKQDLICKIINENCQQSSQKIGNCWWLSQKSAILGILVLQNLLNERAKHPGKKENEEAYQQIFDTYYDVYKYFSEFILIQILKEYVERPMDEAERDHKLVQKVVKKLESKKWKYLEDTGILLQTYRFLAQATGMKTKEKLPPIYSKTEINEWIQSYKDTYKLDYNFNPDKPEMYISW